jgi:hypothetical protein
MKGDVERSAPETAALWQAIPEDFTEAEDAGWMGHSKRKLKAQSSKFQTSSKMQFPNSKPRENFGREPIEQCEDLEFDSWSLELLWNFEL